MSVIGERLKFLREEKNYSQAEFAEKMGVNRMTINNYENGRRTPDIVFAANVAEHYNVTLEYLTGLSEFRHKEDKEESIIKANRLMSVIEKIPQIEGQQMLNQLSNLLETSNKCSANMPILIGLMAAITEFDKVLTGFTELEENIKRNVSELRWQQIQPVLIQWTCFEKTKAISENTLEASKEIYSALQLCSKLLSKKLVKLLETESEK